MSEEIHTTFLEWIDLQEFYKYPCGKEHLVVDFIKITNGGSKPCFQPFIADNTPGTVCASCFINQKEEKENQNE